ncbi:hypothetical protein ACHWGL_32360, partial [Klebsiella pneumoniae]
PIFAQLQQIVVCKQLQATLQLGKYRRPIGFVLRRPGMEMLKLDTLSMADAATILMRSGPATLCIWSRDDILRQASEAVIRER